MPASDLETRLVDYLEQRPSSHALDQALVAAILRGVRRGEYEPAECVEAWCVTAEDAVERLKADLARQPWWPGYDPDAEDDE